MKVPEYPEELKRFFAECGRRGARITNGKLSKKERKEAASKASRARWAKFYAAFAPRSDKTTELMSTSAPLSVWANLVRRFSAGLSGVLRHSFPGALISRIPVVTPFKTQSAGPRSCAVWAEPWFKGYSTVSLRPSLPNQTDISRTITAYRRLRSCLLKRAGDSPTLPRLTFCLGFTPHEFLTHSFPAEKPFAADGMTKFSENCPPRSQPDRFRAKKSEEKQPWLVWLPLKGATTP